MNAANLNYLKGSEERLGVALTDAAIEIVQSQYGGIGDFLTRPIGSPHRETAETNSATITYESVSNGIFNPYNTISSFEAEITPIKTYEITRNGISTEANIAYGERVDDYWSIVAGFQEYARDYDDEVDECLQDALDELENIERLHGKLTTSPKLSDVGELIRKQETDILTDVFNEDTHIENQPDTEIGSLFSNGAIEITTTDSYVLVAPDETDEAFVVGTDDTPVGVFVHTVDGRDLDLSSTTVTDEKIRTAMGYTYDLDEAPDYTRKWKTVRDKLEETTRIQGDLGVRPRLKYTTHPDAIANAILADEFMNLAYRLSESWSFKNDFFSAAEVVVEPLGYLKIELNETIYEVLNDYTRVGTMLRGRNSSLNSFERPSREPEINEFRHRDIQQGELWKHKYEFTSDSVLPNPDDITSRNGIRSRDVIKHRVESELRELLTDALPQKLDLDGVDYFRHSREITDSDQFEEFEEKASTRLNLPIDNHLLMFDKAMLYPCTIEETSPVTVLVAERSDVTIMHGEHDTKTLELPPGVYTFDLLRRGLRVNETDAYNWRRSQSM